MSEPGAGSRETVTRWLLQEGWKLQEETPNQAAAWSLGGEDSQGKKIGFAQLVGRPDSVAVHAAMTYSEDDTKRLNGMEPGKRDELLWEIRFRLLEMDVSFQGVELPLRRIFMNRTVYMDGLTKREFMEEVSRVQRAILLVHWLYRRHMGEQPAADGGLPVN
jgi:hypothetical protein